MWSRVKLSVRGTQRWKLEGVPRVWGFPGGSVVKNPPAGDARDVGSIPGLGRALGVGNGNPLQYSCLENSMDRGVWQATDHEVAKTTDIDTTEHSTASQVLKETVWLVQRGLEVNNRRQDWEGELGPVFKGLKCQARAFVLIFTAGSSWEPLKTFEQEIGSTGDFEFQENLPGVGWKVRSR